MQSARMTINLKSMYSGFVLRFTKFTPIAKFLFSVQAPCVP